MYPAGSKMNPVPAPCGTSPGGRPGVAAPLGAPRFCTSTVAGRTWFATATISGSVPPAAAAGDAAGDPAGRAGRLGDGVPAAACANCRVAAVGVTGAVVA